MSRLLQDVVGELSKLPGVGRRTALRLAIHILRMDADARERRDLADRLILTNAPPLNEDERVRLVATEESAEQKAKTRAA